MFKVQFLLRVRLRPGAGLLSHLAMGHRVRRLGARGHRDLRVVADVPLGLVLREDAADGGVAAAARQFSHRPAQQVEQIYNRTIDLMERRRVDSDG